ncbi:hypothetical protein ACSTS3_14405 [Aquimarina muelleri]|uniref:hypothetical protein n=1 Tax=Aquimarina muelleri TaxID=279356 RepID=UPI003F6847FF
MERKKETKNKYPSTRIITDNIDTLKKVTQKDYFSEKPIVKIIANTVLISGTIFGVLFLSRYFLSATAKMINSCKEVRDAWKK